MIGGRDQQQNELLVKRYLKPGEFSLRGHNFHCVTTYTHSIFKTVACEICLIDSFAFEFEVDIPLFKHSFLHLLSV